MFINKKRITNRRANKVGLFCNARDESNIREWAAHHLLVGFDLIIIFDHKSTVPLKNVFVNFDKRVVINEIKTNKQNIKNTLMNCATNIAKNLNLDWFIYLDADEFLILHNKFKGVKHFLNTYSYGDSVGVNWLMFGSNYLIEEPDGLILENYTRSRANLDRHVKSFVRPQEIINTHNPHFYNMINKNRMLGLGFNILQRPQCFNELNIPYSESPAYIAHYVFQSENTYKKRKIDKIGDDGIKRQDMGKDIHNHYNDVINVEPQKYVNRVKEFLQYYS
jgi:hypothetical protein